MTFEPAAMIQGLANGNAIQPRLQRTALTKVTDSFERFQEHFLSGVGSVGRIPQHAEDQVVDRGMVVGYQPVEGRFRAGLQLGDEVGFILAPREGTCPIGHGLPFFALPVRAKTNWPFSVGPPSLPKRRPEPCPLW